MTEQSHTTIRVSQETKERLREHGKKDESYDELLNHVLDVFEEADTNEN